METNTLQLIFSTSNGKTYTLSIDQPKLPYDVQAINDCVDSILNTGIFESKNGSLVGIKEVRLITKNIEKVNLA